MNGRKASDTVDGSFKSGVHQLRLVVNPIIDSIFFTCQVHRTAKLLLLKQVSSEWQVN